MNFHIISIIFYFKNKMSCSCIDEPIYDPKKFYKYIYQSCHKSLIKKLSHPLYWKPGRSCVISFVIFHPSSSAYFSNLLPCILASILLLFYLIQHLRFPVILCSRKLKHLHWDRAGNLNDAFPYQLEINFIRI